VQTSSRNETGGLEEESTIFYWENGRVDSRTIGENLNSKLEGETGRFTQKRKEKMERGTLKSLTKKD